MALLVREARTRLTPEAGKALGLCPDPTNQLRRYPASDPLAELAALSDDMIKIVHFKQARDGRAHPTVDTGRPRLCPHDRDIGSQGLSKVPRS